MKTNRSYKKWVDRLANWDRVWAEKEIIAFRRAVGQCGIRDEEQRDLLRAIFVDRAPYRITDEQSKKGRSYLLGKSLRLDGTRRVGCKLGDFELSVLLRLSRQLLVGLHSCENGMGVTTHYAPVYRAVSSTGEYFDYIGVTYEQLEVVGQGSAGGAS